MDATELDTLAEAFAFLGNSLLRPMSQTSDAGLSPEFWDAFPAGRSASSKSALEGCRAFALAASSAAEAGEDAVERASVEYTRLFVGPPRPAAAPWETAYRGAQGPDGFVGYGEATVAMRNALRGLGLEIRNENNQYADHMGIELLCLSEMLKRAAKGALPDSEMLAFLRERPLSWADAFAAKVEEACADGYFAPLTALVAAMLHDLSEGVPASAA